MVYSSNSTENNTNSNEVSDKPYNHLSSFTNKNYNPSSDQGPSPTPSPTNSDDFSENFTNMNPVSKVNLDLVLKALFFGAIFYLLSLPELYKMTKRCCKSVDGVLLHSIVFAVVYYVVVHFI